ncbi:polyadenylate-binding protein-interacting protein 1, putative [Plasmodium ovale]|uniref:Polyadenylate-binding protein-interacting protein 1, putative n=1 Tax=Plasmodium ovale TaxID=36330 RepID=A0A1D3THG5_PLAOA|nr:polyadenylate-binding protein-interacting protein 1, putative [Plasmodium ovale]
MQSDIIVSKDISEYNSRMKEIMNVTTSYSASACMEVSGENRNNGNYEDDKTEFSNSSSDSNNNKKKNKNKNKTKFSEENMFPSKECNPNTTVYTSHVINNQLKGNKSYICAQNNSYQNSSSQNCMSNYDSSSKKETTRDDIVIKDNKDENSKSNIKGGIHNGENPVRRNGLLNTQVQVDEDRTASDISMNGKINGSAKNYSLSNVVDDSHCSLSSCSQTNSGEHGKIGRNVKTFEGSRNGYKDSINPLNGTSSSDDAPMNGTMDAGNNESKLCNNSTCSGGSVKDANNVRSHHGGDGNQVERCASGQGGVNSMMSCSGSAGSSGGNVSSNSNNNGSGNGKGNGNGNGNGNSSGSGGNGGNGGNSNSSNRGNRSGGSGKDDDDNRKDKNRSGGSSSKGGGNTNNTNGGGKSSEENGEDGKKNNEGDRKNDGGNKRNSNTDSVVKGKNNINSETKNSVNNKAQSTSSKLSCSNNVASLSSLNADAPEFVPSTKGGMQGSLQFNNLLWNNYYQDMSNNAFGNMQNGNIMNNMTSQGSNNMLNPNSLMHHMGGGMNNGAAANLVNMPNGSNVVTTNGLNMNVPGGHSSHGNMSCLNMGNINNMGNFNNMSNLNSLNNNAGVVLSSSPCNMNNVESFTDKGNNNTSGSSSNNNNANGSVNNGKQLNNNNTLENTLPGSSSMHGPSIGVSKSVGTPSDANFLNQNMISGIKGMRGNNFINTTSGSIMNNGNGGGIINGSENSAQPFHPMDAHNGNHQNFQPNGSMIHHPNFYVNPPPYMLNNHPNGLPVPQSLFGPMAFGNNIGSSNVHHDLPFPQPASSVYGSFGSNHNIIGNNNLTSQKNANMNINPYNFMSCGIPSPPQLQHNAPLNMNPTVDPHFMTNSGNSPLKIPYNHVNQGNRRNMFNQFNNTSIHSGSNLSDHNFEQGNNSNQNSNMSPVMTGNLNYNFNGFSTNQNNNMHMNGDNSNMHLNGGLGNNNIPMNNGGNVMCMNSPMHLNNAANVPPPHHHLNNVGAGLHMNGMHMSHGLLIGGSGAAGAAGASAVSGVSSVGNVNAVGNIGGTTKQQKRINERGNNNNNVSGSAVSGNAVGGSGKQYGYRESKGATKGSMLSGGGAGAGFSSYNMKHDSKKQGRYNTSNNASGGFNASYNANTSNSMNNASSTSKNIYSSKGTGGVKNELYGRDETGGGLTSPSVSNNYYQRSSTSSNCNVANVGSNSNVRAKSGSNSNVGLNVGEEYMDGMSYANNKDGAYSAYKGKEYNMSKSSGKGKGSGGNVNHVFSNINGSTQNEASVEKRAYNKGEKGSGSHTPHGSSSNNKEDYRSGGRNYHMGSKMSEEKNVSIGKKDIPKDKSGKQSDISQKKGYNDMNNVGNGVGSSVNNGKQQSAYLGGKYQGGTDKRGNNLRPGDNNKMSEKKNKHEEEKKYKEKDNSVTINSANHLNNVSMHNVHNDNIAGKVSGKSTNKSVSKGANVTSGNTSVMQNGESGAYTSSSGNNTVGYSNSMVNNKSGNYSSLKNVKNYEKKNMEFCSWVKIAKMNPNKRKGEKANNNVTTTHDDNINVVGSGGAGPTSGINVGKHGEQQHGNSNQNMHSTDTHYGNTKVYGDGTSSNNSRGYNGELNYLKKGGSYDAYANNGISTNVVVTKEGKKRNAEEDEEGEEGVMKRKDADGTLLLHKEKENSNSVHYIKNGKKMVEDKNDVNVKNKKMVNTYASSKSYADKENNNNNSSSNNKDGRQKSKYESSNKKGSLAERKGGGGTNVPGGSSTYSSQRQREKQKIQNVEIKQIGEKMLGSNKRGDDFKDSTERGGIPERQKGGRNGSNKKGLIRTLGAIDATATGDVAHAAVGAGRMHRDEVEKSLIYDKTNTSALGDEYPSKHEGEYSDEEVHIRMSNKRGGVHTSANGVAKYESVRRRGDSQKDLYNNMVPSSEGRFSRNKQQSSIHVEKKVSTEVAVTTTTSAVPAVVSAAGSQGKVQYKYAGSGAGTSEFNGASSINDNRSVSTYSNSKNSVWDGKITFAEMAKRKPKKESKELKEGKDAKSESQHERKHNERKHNERKHNERKHIDSSNKSDKSSKRGENHHHNHHHNHHNHHHQHRRYGSNGTVQDKAGTCGKEEENNHISDNKDGGKELRKLNEQKEEEETTKVYTTSNVHISRRGNKNVLHRIHDNKEKEKKGKDMADNIRDKENVQLLDAESDGVSKSKEKKKGYNEDSELEGEKFDDKKSNEEEEEEIIEGEEELDNAIVKKEVEDDDGAHIGKMDNSSNKRLNKDMEEEKKGKEGKDSTSQVETLVVEKLPQSGDDVDNLMIRMEAERLEEIGESEEVSKKVRDVCNDEQKLISSDKDVDKVRDIIKDVVNDSKKELLVHKKAEGEEAEEEKHFGVINEKNRPSKDTKIRKGEIDQVGLGKSREHSIVGRDMITTSRKEKVEAKPTEKDKPFDGDDIDVGKKVKTFAEDLQIEEEKGNKETEEGVECGENRNKGKEKPAESITSVGKASAEGGDNDDDDDSTVSKKIQRKQGIIDIESSRATSTNKLGEGNDKSPRAREIVSEKGEVVALVGKTSTEIDINVFHSEVVPVEGGNENEFLVSLEKRVDELDDKKASKEGVEDLKEKERQKKLERLYNQKRFTKIDLLEIYLGHNWNLGGERFNFVLSYDSSADIDYNKSNSHGSGSAVNHLDDSNSSGVIGGGSHINHHNVGSSNGISANELKTVSVYGKRCNAGGYNHSNSGGGISNSSMNYGHGNVPGSSSSGAVMGNHHHGGGGNNHHGKGHGGQSGNHKNSDDGWRHSHGKNAMNSVFTSNHTDNNSNHGNIVGSSSTTNEQNSSGKSGQGSLEWRKSDGDKLKGFFDSTRAIDSSDAWRFNNNNGNNVGGVVGNTGSNGAGNKSVTENSWIRKQKQLKTDKYTCMMRKLRGILNKLTFEKFDLLYEQIILVGISKLEEIIGLMKLVFEKAVTQHHFVQMYVQLCKKLNVHFHNMKLEDDTTVQFKKILINQCQDSFENNLKPIEFPSNLNEEERFEFEQMHKNKVRGNMLFVGELVKSGIISIPIVFVCIKQLLEKRESYITQKNDTNEGNLHLEALCMFLNTVGEILDTHEKANQEKVKELYNTLHELVNDESITFRVRCLIKDVIDNRSEKWNKKFAHKLEGPTTLSVLHDKILKESIDQSSRNFSSMSNYHDSKISSSLSNMRNNLLRNANFGTSSAIGGGSGMVGGGMGSAFSIMNSNVNMRNMNGLGGKNMDSNKNLKKLSLNLMKSKNSVPASKIADELKSANGMMDMAGVGSNTIGGGNVGGGNIGGGSYFDMMSKNHIPFKNQPFMSNEGGSKSGNAAAGGGSGGSGGGFFSSLSSRFLNKDKNEGKFFMRNFNLKKGASGSGNGNANAEAQNVEAQTIQTQGEVTNVGIGGTLMPTSPGNGAEKTSKTSASTSTNSNNDATTTNSSNEKESGQNDYTFVEEYLPKVNEILELSTSTEEWEELTKKLEELNIPAKFNEKLQSNILKLTLKKYACNKNVEKSSDYFNWLISTVLSNKIDIESFKPCWKSFILEKDENSYEYTKEDYPLLPFLAKNFIKAIELYDTNHLLYDVSTIDQMKSVI